MAASTDLDQGPDSVSPVPLSLFLGADETKNVSIMFDPPQKIEGRSSEVMERKWAKGPVAVVLVIGMFIAYSLAPTSVTSFGPPLQSQASPLSVTDQDAG